MSKFKGMMSHDLSLDDCDSLLCLLRSVSCGSEVELDWNLGVRNPNGAFLILNKYFKYIKHPKQMGEKMVEDTSTVFCSQ